MVKMSKDEMVEWFKSAPEGSRHQRMLWAAHKIARLTGATEGGIYQLLLVALIEAEGTDEVPNICSSLPELWAAVFTR